MTFGTHPYFRIPSNGFRLSPKLLIRSDEENATPFIELFTDKLAVQAETDFRVERLATFDEYLEQDHSLGREGQRNIFQQVVFLQAWFASFGHREDVEPLLLRVVEASTGHLIMLLPLIIWTHQGVRTIEFADLGSIDYNAPVLSDFAPKDPIASESMWQAIKRALPAADIIRLEKMPFKVGDHINPFVLCQQKQDCRFFGQRFDTGGNWDTYIRTKNPKFAKDTRRRRRRLGEIGDVEFKQITDNEEAEACLLELNRMQKDRLEEAGRSHNLDEFAYQLFYRKMLIENMENGKVRLFSLCVDNKIVALLYGISMGDEFSVLRITHAGKDWNNCSPGRLIIIETIQLLENEGFRNFDLTIGDYYFKERFRPEKYQLYSLTEALSPIGKMVLLGNRFRSFFKKELNQICNLSKATSTK
jgi:CelD/BcsL family acetyltransferase involved in cellulose biosynthesis